MSEVYSRTEMIKAIRDYLQKEGYSLQIPYDKIFSPARVPIFGHEKEKGEIFVDIITEARIKLKSYFHTREYSLSLNELKIKNASSAEFFRHYFPHSSVYWAFPSYAEKNRDFNLFVSQCKRRGIGLMEVTRIKGKNFLVSKLFDVPPLFEDRFSKLVGLISNMGVSSLTPEQDVKLRRVLKEHIQEDISYLVFYPEPKYLAADISIRDDEDRKISTQLINRMGELKKVSYRRLLNRFAETYYREATDDYSLALSITGKIWNRYKIGYPNLHRDFEEVLKLDPKYRDHFLHAFQVFLFGVYVIDQLYDELHKCKPGFGTRIGDRIEDAWAIAATYHDYNYMIQNFDEWTKKFFAKALHLSENGNNPASLQLGEPYVKGGYMLNTKKLAEILPLNVNHDVLKFLYEKILNDKNHGLISGLSLLKYLDIKKNILSERVKNAACKAISIHDLKILAGLRDIADGTNNQKGRPRSKSTFRNITFKDDPISFLLLLADCLQEQGRIDLFEDAAELLKLYSSGDKIFIEVSFNGPNAAEKYDGKITELNTLKKYVSSEGRFTLKITGIIDGGNGITEPRITDINL